MDKILKSKLKAEYKQTMTKMGVFQIKNNINGKIFIGKAMNLDGILNSQRFQLIHGGHSNKELSKDWKEFGQDNFSFEILDQLKPVEEAGNCSDYIDDLAALEQIWLEKLQPFVEKGYNKRPK